MSTYIISDIHGCNITFRKALKAIRLKKSDRLILLGDLIDRGVDSKGVLDTVLLLLENGFDVQCIMGNHEKFLLDSLSDLTSKITWLRNGGKETLRSFLTSDVERIPQKYIDFIKTFKYYLLLDNYILVHAGVNMTIEDPFSDQYSLLWLRDWGSLFDSKWLGERVIIHGHTPTEKISIMDQFSSNRQVICIDNGAYINDKTGYGSICVLNLEKKTFYFEQNSE